MSEYGKEDLGHLTARITELGSVIENLEEKNTGQNETIARMTETIKTLNTDLVTETNLREENRELRKQNAHMGLKCYNERETVAKLTKEISRLQQTVFSAQRDAISSVVSPTTAEIAANAPVIVHKWESGERPVGLKLTKTTKGYTWEISMKGTDAEKMFEQVEIFEAEVRLKYGESGETSSPGKHQPKGE